MTYRLGESEAIEVNGIIFFARRAAKPRFEFLRALADLGDDASQVQLAEAETQFLLDVIVGVEGLVDETGSPIEQLTEDILWELDPETKIELAEECLAGREDGDSGKATGSADRHGDGQPDGE